MGFVLEISIFHFLEKGGSITYFFFLYALLGIVNR